jgi:hypothetical protein
MRFDDIKISSVSELLSALQKQTKLRDLIWFRGHAQLRWKLLPSLARNPAHLRQETDVIKRFIQLAVPHLIESLPQSDWDWIFLMQHHRVPTRLLDWSESPLAALWFAVNSTSTEDLQSDGAVWCLDPLALNREARLRGRLETELPGFESDPILDNYLPDRQDQGAGQNPVAASGRRNSRRMAAQLGNFTIFDRSLNSIEEVGARNHVWRLVIPAAAKAQISEELRLLRFTELTLFPDLDRVANLTRELLT